MKNDTASKQEDTGAMVPVKESGGLRGFIDDYNKDNSYPFRNFRFQMERMMKGYDFDGKDILDVGCGTGEFLCRVSAEKGATLSGVDISPEMVRIAKERPEDVFRAVVPNFVNPRPRQN